MDTPYFLALLSADIVEWIIGRPIENSVDYLILITIIGFLRSEKYKKQPN